MVATQLKLVQYTATTYPSSCFKHFQVKRIANDVIVDDRQGVTGGHGVQQPCIARRQQCAVSDKRRRKRGVTARNDAIQVKAILSQGPGLCEQHTCRCMLGMS